MSFDTRCHDLALVFLDDEPGYENLSVEERSRLADQIAQDIQGCIEDSLQDARDNQRFISPNTPEDPKRG